MRKTILVILTALVAVMGLTLNIAVKAQSNSTLVYSFDPSTKGVYKDTYMADAASDVSYTATQSGAYTITDSTKASVANGTLTPSTKVGGLYTLDISANILKAGTVVTLDFSSATSPVQVFKSGGLIAPIATPGASQTPGATVQPPQVGYCVATDNNTQLDVWATPKPLVGEKWIAILQGGTVMTYLGMDQETGAWQVQTPAGTGYIRNVQYVHPVPCGSGTGNPGTGGVTTPIAPTMTSGASEPSPTPTTISSTPNSTPSITSAAAITDSKKFWSMANLSQNFYAGQLKALLDVQPSEDNYWISQQFLTDWPVLSAETINDDVMILKTQNGRVRYIFPGLLVWQGKFSLTLSLNGVPVSYFWMGRDATLAGNVHFIRDQQGAQNVTVTGPANFIALIIENNR